MTSFTLDITVTASCKHCSWRREFTGPNASVEATAAGTAHTIQEHPSEVYR